VGGAIKWPPEIREQRRATECRRQPWITHLVEYEGFDESSREVSRASALGSLPLIVLSHDTSAPGQMATLRTQLQTDLARLSTHSTLEVVPGSTHNLQDDHPSVIIDAVRAEVEEAR
jgi:pimeloyl-ACP methyl ester carboxylesterase